MIKIKYQILKIGQKEINENYFLFKEFENDIDAENFMLTIINDIPKGYYIKIIGKENE